MSFWNTEKWKDLGKHGGVVIPFDDNRIKHGGYELSLGNEYYKSSDKVKQNCEAGEQIQIEAGQFAVLITQEEIHIPTFVIGFISIKFGIKAQGLINVSGFHVDPGFKGKLKFSVYNAGVKPITLDVGKPLFLIWIASLCSDTSDSYSGDHNNQQNITSSDVSKIHGISVSPAALDDRVKAIEEFIRNSVHGIRWALGIFAMIFAGIIATIGATYLINTFP